VAIPNVVQMDIVRFPNVDVMGVNQTLPFRDASFDAIFSLDVLEHVNDPFTSASEIIRILKPGGVLYLDLPFLQVEHGYPHHYFNATRMGVRHLFSELECLGHHVPASGQPMFIVHHLLSLYHLGLPTELRSRFEAMTVGDVLAKSPLEWLDDDLVQQLDEETRWVIASATQALFRKAPLAASDTSTFAVSPSDVPAFAPQHR
jgi:SAM-dependent methyltransferase